MGLSLAETQAVAELADFLYPLLPGTPHPYADQAISFRGAAAAVSLGRFWTSASKKSAITTLLTRTLDERRDQFCPLMVQIVRQAMNYKNGQ